MLVGGWPCVRCRVLNTITHLHCWLFHWSSHRPCWSMHSLHSCLPYGEIKVSSYSSGVHRTMPVIAHGYPHDCLATSITWPTSWAVPAGCPCILFPDGNSAIGGNLVGTGCGGVMATGNPAQQTGGSFQPVQCLGKSSSSKVQVSRSSMAKESALATAVHVGGSKTVGGAVPYSVSWTGVRWQRHSSEILH